MGNFQSILPEGWKRASGWSHGTAAPAGLEVHIAGQFGCDPATQEVVSDDFGKQWAQALANVRAVVEAAGGTTQDILSLRVFVTSMEQYEGAGAQLGSAWMEHIGKTFPAMTLVQVGRLTDPRACVEIEGVARISEERGREG